MKSLIKHVQKVRERRPDTLVGYVLRNRRRLPLRWSDDQLRGHTLVLGKLGTGKTTLLGHVTKAAIQNRSTLVVVDTQGQLVHDVLAQVPPERAQDVMWMDLTDETRSPGLNLLDLSQGDDPTAVVADILHIAPDLWRDFWEPRIEIPLQIALETLLAANRSLVAKHEPQFTLLDIPDLFLDAEFRHRLLDKYVTDDDLKRWWCQTYEQAYAGINADFLPGVMAPLNRLSMSPGTKHLLGQSSSTFQFEELLRPGRIVLINACTSNMVSEIRRWIAPLIVDRIHATILAREPLAEWQRVPSTVIAVCGFMPRACVQDPALLAQLRKRGTSYLLVSSELPRWRGMDPTVPRVFLGNIANLFALRTIWQDAEVVAPELGAEVQPKGLTWLPDYTGYLRYRCRDGEMRVEHIETLPPLHRDLAAAKQVLDGSTPCARPEGEIEADYQEFQAKWYGHPRRYSSGAMESNEPLDKGDERVNP